MTFLSEKHPLDEFMEIILYYKRISIDIPLSLQKTVPIGLYDMHRKNLINVLIENSKSFTRKLVVRCVQDYQNNCRQ